MASNYYAVPVSTTAVRIASFQGVCLVANNGAGLIYLGWDGNVTAASGFPVGPGNQVSIAAQGVQNLYAVAASSQDVRIMIGYL